MKKVEAIIRPEKLDSVRKALEEIGIISMTVTEVSGRGRQKGIVLQWRAGEYRVDLLPKVKLEVVVPEEHLHNTIVTIMNSARTGETGDGKVFILPIEDALRVRTGEVGANAI